MAGEPTGTERTRGPVNTKAPTVTVIIPVYDDADRLRICLAALAGQDYPEDRFDVVVVDNASTVSPESALPDGDSRFRIVFEGQRGSYAARNTGVAHAKGEILAFTDSDCVPHHDWLSTGVAALQHSGGQDADGPDAAGGAIRLTFRGGGGPRTGPELYESLHGFSQQKYIEEFSFAATANLFVPAPVFAAVGEFNAQLRSGGDLDWGTRLGAAGRRMVYVPELVVDHPSRSTWPEMTRKAVRVANGLADLATGESRRVLLIRAAREAKRGVLVWVDVWRRPEPSGPGSKLRYAAAFCAVSLIRAAVRVRRAVSRTR